MSTASFVFEVDGVAADATSVVLSDATGSYGVKRDDTDAAVVDDGTAMTKTSTGHYAYTFDDPDGFLDSTYTYAIEAVYGGETYRWQYTQDGPASVSSLVTLAQAKAYLGVTASTDDTIIGAILAGATAAMEARAGRHLVSTSRTEYMDGDGGRWLYLAEPAESITSIHVSSDQTWDATTLEAAADYALSDCQVDHLDEVWSTGRRNIRAIYAAGFATVPSDLVEACKRETARRYAHWQRAKEGKDNLEAETVEGWTRKWARDEELDPQVAAVCDRYQAARL